MKMEVNLSGIRIQPLDGTGEHILNPTVGHHR